MFEKSAAELVDRICGSFIQDVDPEQMKISMWKGEVELNNVKLKSSALDGLNLPVAVKRGQLAYIHFKIPWKSLGSSPVIVTIRGVDAEVVGIEQTACTSTEQRKEMVQHMLAKCREDVVARANSTKGSFTGRLFANVIDNLVLHFSDIRLVYRDHHTPPSSSFAIDLRLDTFSVDTANQSWEPVEFAVSDQEMRKLFSLTGVAVQWQRPAPDTELGDTSLQHSSTFLIEPVSLSGHVCFVKADAVAQNVPVITVDLKVDQLRLNIDQLLVRDIVALVDSGQHTSASTSQSMPQVLRYGAEYAQLFKRGLRLLPLPELSDAEITRMADLAECAPASFLADVRRKALESIHQQVVAILAAAPLQEQPAARGMWSRMLGGQVSEAPGAGAGAGEGPGGMSEEERARMEAVVEAARSAAARQEQMLEAAPEDYVAFSVSLAAASVSLAVASVAPQRGAQGRELLGKVEVTEMRGGALLRRFNHSLTVAVGSMDAVGASARGGAMAQLVGMDEQDRGGVTDDGDGAVKGSGAVEDGGRVQAFLAVGVEVAPRDGGFDHAVSVQLQRVKWVHRPECVEAILAWAKEIKSELERQGVGASRTRDVASRPLASLRAAMMARARMALELSKRRRVKVEGFISMPKIFLPPQLAESSGAPGHNVLLELGSIRIQTVGPVPHTELGAKPIEYQLILSGSQLRLQCAQDEHQYSQVVYPVKCELSIAIPQPAPARPHLAGQPPPGKPPLKITLNIPALHGTVSPQHAQALITTLSSWPPANTSAEDALSASAALATDSNSAESGGSTSNAAASVEVGCCIDRVQLTLTSDDHSEVAEVCIEHVSVQHSVGSCVQDTKLRVRNLNLSHALSNFASDSESSESDLKLHEEEVEFALPLYSKLLTSQNPERDTDVEDEEDWLHVDVSSTKVDGKTSEEYTACVGGMWVSLCPVAVNVVLRWVEESGCLTLSDSAALQVYHLHVKLKCFDLRLVDVDNGGPFEVAHMTLTDVEVEDQKESDGSAKTSLRVQDIALKDVHGTSTAEEHSLIVTVENPIDQEPAVAWLDEYAPVADSAGLSRVVTLSLAGVRVNLVSSFLQHSIGCLAALSAFKPQAEPSQAKSDSLSLGCAVNVRLVNFAVYVPQEYVPDIGILVKLDATPSNDVAGSSCVGTSTQTASLFSDLKMTGCVLCEGTIHNVLALAGSLSFVSARSPESVDQHDTHLRVKDVCLSAESRVLVLAQQVVSEAHASFLTSLRPRNERHTRRNLLLPAVAALHQEAGDDQTQESGASSSSLVFQVSIDTALIAVGVSDSFHHQRGKQLPDDGPVEGGSSMQAVVLRVGDATAKQSKSNGNSSLEMQVGTLSLDCSDRLEWDEVNGNLPGLSVLTGCRRVFAFESEGRYQRKVHHMTTKYAEAFQKSDTQARGFLETEQLVDAFAELGVSMDVAQAATLHAALDADCDGKVDMAEFLQLVRIFLKLDETDIETQAERASNSTETDPGHSSDAQRARGLLIQWVQHSDTDQQLAVHVPRFELDLAAPSAGVIAALWRALVSERERMQPDSPMHLSPTGSFRGQSSQTSNHSDLWGLLEVMGLLRVPFRSPADAQSAHESSLRFSVTVDSAEVTLSCGNAMGRTGKNPAFVLPVQSFEAEGALRGAIMMPDYRLKLQGLEVLHSDDLEGDPRKTHQVVKKIDITLNRRVIRNGTENHLDSSMSLSTSDGIDIELGLQHAARLVALVQSLQAATRRSSGRAGGPFTPESPVGVGRVASAGGILAQQRPPLGASLRRVASAPNQRPTIGQPNGSSSPLGSWRPHRFSQHPPGARGALSNLSVRYRREESLVNAMAEIEDERQCAGSRTVSWSWSLKLSSVRARLFDDIQQDGVSLARAGMQELSLVSTVDGDTHMVAGSVTVSCSAFHQFSGQWEPILEPWTVWLEAVTTRADPKQFLTISSQNIEVSFAAEHLVRAHTAYLSFQDTYEAMHNSLIAAEMSHRVESASSDADGKKELSTLVKDLTSKNVIFTNATTVAVALKLQLPSEDAMWESTVSPGDTAAVPQALLESHLLYIRACRPAATTTSTQGSGAEEWSRWSSGLEKMSGIGDSVVQVECRGLDDAWRVMVHLRSASNGKGFAAHAPWKLHSLLPHRAAFVVADQRKCTICPVAALDPQAGAEDAMLHCDLSGPDHPGPLWASTEAAMISSLSASVSSSMEADTETEPEKMGGNLSEPPNSATKEVKICGTLAEFELQAGAEIELLCNDLSLGPSTFLGVSVRGLQCVEWVAVGGDGVAAAERIELVDESGRRLFLMLHIATTAQQQTVLTVFADTVMVNRTGLPLIFGCARNTRSAKQQEELEQVQVAAGQSWEEGMVHVSAEGWSEHNFGWMRSAAVVHEVGGAWNEVEPATVMMSPAQHADSTTPDQWSPCVAMSMDTSGAGARWKSVALQGAEDTQGLRLEGMLTVGVDKQSDGHVVEVETEELTSFFVAVSVRIGHFPFHRTTYMDFSPLYSIVNRTGFTVQAIQFPSHRRSAVLQIEDSLLLSTCGAFHDLRDNPEHRLQVRLLDHQGLPVTSWSGPFFLEEERIFPLRLLPAKHEADERESQHLVVQISALMAAKHITLMLHDEEAPLIQVINTSQHNMELWQKGSEKVRVQLDKGEPRMFSWDDPDALLTLSASFLQVPEFVVTLDTEKFEETQRVDLGSSQVVFQSRMIGSCKLITVEDAASHHKSTSVKDLTVFEFNVAIPAIGLSLVDDNRIELLYASLQNVELALLVQQETILCSAAASKLETDNQTAHGQAKAFFSPFTLREKSQGSGEANIHARISGVLSREASSVLYWRDVKVETGDFCIQLEEEWLHSLLMLEEEVLGAKSAASSQHGSAEVVVRAQTGAHVEAEERIRSISRADSEEPSTSKSGSYIHSLALSKCSGRVSVYGMSGALARPQGTSGGPVNTMYRGARVVASMFPIGDVHQHMIELAGLRKKGIRLKNGEGLSGIATIISGHYRAKLSGEAMKLLGSADFLASCLKIAVESRMAGMDRHHRAALKRGGQGERSEPGSFHGLTSGLHQGLVELWEKGGGATEAAKNGDAVEAVASLGQGVYGLFAKPAQGLLQLGDLTPGTGFSADRARPPRAVYTDGVLRKYDAAEAAKFAWLIEAEEKHAAVLLLSERAADASTVQAWVQLEVQTSSLTVTRAIKPPALNPQNGTKDTSTPKVLREFTF